MRTKPTLLNPVTTKEDGQANNSSKGSPSPDEAKMSLPELLSQDAEYESILGSRAKRKSNDLWMGKGGRDLSSLRSPEISSTKTRTKPGGLSTYNLVPALSSWIFGGVAHRSRGMWDQGLCCSCVGIGNVGDRNSACLEVEYSQH